MKPELWHYGSITRIEIEEVLEQRATAEYYCAISENDEYAQEIKEQDHTLSLWQKEMAIEIRGLLGNWHEYENKGDAEKYLEYLKFLFILAGGEPCAW